MSFSENLKNFVNERIEASQNRLKNNQLYEETVKHQLENMYYVDKIIKNLNEKDRSVMKRYRERELEIWSLEAGEIYFQGLRDVLSLFGSLK